ncbi:MAG: tRNA uracil 4-sulfurtransferase ThiI [Candidatus Spyradocola sp.]|nr:tRNA uracil 4-sulfurtransferase ThiI [Candidatus Spyradocola sp.]
MKNVLLVRMGEIFLKGDNRMFFIKALVRHIKKAVDGTGASVELTQGRIFLRDITDMEDVIRRVTRVFGVHSVSPVVQCEKTMDAICREAVEMMKPLSGTFKCAARRADKRFPLDSMQINEEVGYQVLTACPQLTVDVHKPQHELNIEVRENAYLYVEKIPAVGGMPVGTNGKAMLLLSGGIDSPVAGYMIAKRGVQLNCIHYHSFPFTSEQAKQKVIDLAKQLSAYAGPIRMYVVPFTELQQELYQKCPESQLTILMRRYMMRIANRIAHRANCSALITGESIGQVASQTMDGLCCTNAVCDMPVFRPLIGFDKIEIMDYAEKIGTYETSILPYEDCCTIFTPKHPQTKPRVEQLIESEKLIDGEGLIRRAIEGIEILNIMP